MSTHAIVARWTDKDAGRFEGRYVHCDGYVGYMLPELQAIVNRDGAETAIATLTNGPGWSYLDSNLNSRQDGTPDPLRVEPMFTLVENYGYRNNNAVEILTEADTGNFAYVYVLDEDGVTVISGGIAETFFWQGE